MKKTPAPHSTYQSAWQRCARKSRRRQDTWKERTRTAGLVITISMPRGHTPLRPEEGVNPSRVAADAGASVSVEEFDPSTVTLTQILDSFGRLPDPRHRVFAGLFEIPSAHAGAVQQRITETGIEISAAPATYLSPVVSGFAQPGSRVAVTFSDELGIPQSQITVHSDEKGHWIAPRAEGTYLSDTQSIFLEITPPLWSGETRSERFYLSFPADALQAQSAQRAESGASGLLGVVIQPQRAADTGPVVEVPQW
jgi:hypothetical protein